MISNRLISVIINCRNSEKYLKPCINSVLNQTYTNFEVLIVDNKSTDRTKEIIKSYSDSRIKYYYLKKPLSLGNARNFALNHSIGDYIAFIDSDDLWYPEKLEKVVNRFSKNIGLIYTNVQYFNESKSFNLYSYRKIYKGDIFNKLIYDYNLCISSCVVSREVIRDNKLQFDKNLRVCEDLDFFLKISYVSKVDYIPEILARYRIHQTNLTSKNLELFFDEYEVTVNNLIHFFNIDEDNFINAIDNNYIKKARYLWKNNRTKEAQLTIGKINNLIFQKFFYSILILFPFKVIKFPFDLIFGSKVEFHEN